MLMSARFRSTCPACQKAINKGAPIDYNRASRTAVHAECATTKQSEPDLARMFNMAYEDQCAAQCGL